MEMQPMHLRVKIQPIEMELELEILAMDSGLDQTKILSICYAIFETQEK
jgi:hypothetical protein